MNVDYLIERKLREEAPELHRLVKDSVFILQGMLEKFLPRFPDFTDHSILHSMDVLEYSNRIIGAEQIERLSPGECYVLIMACYLHDIGMGVGQKDYEEFSRQIDFGDYFAAHNKEDIADAIRAFHHEFSGCFIRKYAELLEIPSDDLVFAVVQASRGHRKTDLFDEREYPDMQTAYGLIRLPFISAVIRLADEIDVGADRNSELLFDASTKTERAAIEAFGTHESVREVEVTEDSIVLHVKPKAPEFVPLIADLNGKIQKTLDYCCRAAQTRSDLRITQVRSIIKEL